MVVDVYSVLLAQAKERGERRNQMTQGMVDFIEQAATEDTG